VANGVEQPADVGGMVGDAKGAPDHLRHPLAGPHLAAEAVRLWPPLQEGRQLGALLQREPRLAARCGMAAQRLHPLLPCPLEPLADRASGHPQRGGDVLLLPALFFQLPGASPSPLAPVELWGLRFHGASIASFYISTQGSVNSKKENTGPTVTETYEIVIRARKLGQLDGNKKRSRCGNNTAPPRLR
jgi:hypothetical protein